MSELNDIFTEADQKLVARFAKFHNENPHVFERFSKMAIELREKGHRKYGAWTLIQVMRWQDDLTTTGSRFKISNDFVALYARLAMHEDERLAGFFNTKQMKKKRSW